MATGQPDALSPETRPAGEPEPIVAAVRAVLFADQVGQVSLTLGRPRQPSAPPASASPGTGLPSSKLKDAKARLSDVVRLAREQGPQHVTVRGKDAVVILSAADYAPRPNRCQHDSCEAVRQ